MAHLCGCYHIVPSPGPYSYPTKHYLPRVDLSVHTTILSTTSRTRLTQVYVNPSYEEPVKECVYEFPLYDGVSVVGFTCHIGSRIITGIVKEKEKARKVYAEAVERGQTAGLLEQFSNSDIFQTRIGNIPAGQKVIVDIIYVGELKHDAETDGIRFTIPTKIAPRYGTSSHHSPEQSGVGANDSGGIRITVDASLEDGSFIRGIQSPSHPIAVTMGSTSTAMQEEPQMHKASATLTLGSAELDKDFVLVLLAKDTATPKALLETYSSLPHQRALMVTLVPKFSLPPSRPEIIFVADRSGSMQDEIPTLISALRIFLKSLPIGVRFNICSFGSGHSLLWPKSRAYSQSTLTEAMRHVDSFAADMGGTETFAAIKATIELRHRDLALEVMLLTDGEIWQQQECFSYLNNEVGNSKSPIRVFSLGIGNSVSHALIEGIARAGNGFAQTVGSNEKLDSKVVRMLKGGLSPHITDYTLEVKYDKNVDDEEEFELVERVTDGLRVLLDESPVEKDVMKVKQKSISLFDTNADPDKEDSAMPDDDGQRRYDHLPTIPIPNLLQAPHKIPPLFPFNRTTVYLLMDPRSSQKTPKAAVLRATSPHGPLELEIPVQAMSEPGETIHQLAAKKAVGDLEEGRGWIFDARDEKGTLIKERFESRFDEMVEREAVRLGVKFQVGGKWCSFVAVEDVDGKEEKTSTSETNVDHRVDDSIEENMFCKSHPTRPSGRETVAALKRYPNMANLVLNADRRIAKLASKRPPASPGSGSLFGNSGPASMATWSTNNPTRTPSAHLASLAQMQQQQQAAQSHYIAPQLTPSSAFGAQAATSTLPSAQPTASKQSTPFGLGQNIFARSATPGSSHATRAVLMSMAPQTLFVAPPHESPSPSPIVMVEESYKVASQDMHASANVPSSYDGMEAEVDEEDDGFEEEFDDFTPPKLDPPKRDSLDELVTLQTFEGWWTLDDALLRVLKLSRGEAEKDVPGDVRLEVWATVLAVRFLEGKLADRKDAWELVVEKARGWLEEQGVSGEVAVRLFEVAGGLFGD